jgi:hypothetical protein
MKISLVGPGIMPIPPTGWGAVEILVWDTKNALEKLGHTVQIVNTPNPNQIISEINSFRPDFVHVHYDEFIGVYSYIQYPKAITSHFGYLERPEMYGSYSNIINAFQKVNPNVFCLSSEIKTVYKNLNLPESSLYVTPNGVNTSAFRFTEFPKYGDRSIYLAKIDYRKRQHLFQSIPSLYYAGNIADSRFDSSVNYLGEWNKEMLYDNLTHYGNLVLLSDGEAHPLVCMEALAAGLGLVISEWAKANLDLSHDFITVIPENKISDLSYVQSKIEENRAVSLQNRKSIVEYSKSFDWIEVLKNYYLPSIESIIHGQE